MMEFAKFHTSYHEQQIFQRENECVKMGTIDQWVESFLGTAKYIFKDDMRFKGCTTVLDRSTYRSIIFPDWVIRDRSIFKPATPGKLPTFSCCFILISKQ